MLQGIPERCQFGCVVSQLQLKHVLAGILKCRVKGLVLPFNLVLSGTALLAYETVSITGDAPIRGYLDNHASVSRLIGVGIGLPAARLKHHGQARTCSGESGHMGTGPQPAQIVMLV